VSSPPGNSTVWRTRSSSTEPTLGGLDSPTVEGYGRGVTARAALGAAACGALLLIAGCGGGDKPSEPLPGASRSIALSSPAFRDGGTIPERFTCSGDEVSPPLRWSGVPDSARELTLLVEDPDAGRFVHWTLLKIPPNVDHLAAGRTPPGAVETENGTGDTGWAGPCPPEDDEPHRYVFALYATDAPLDLGKDASPDDVRSALKEHVLARGTLSARFGR
jgi:Raf kinase inhibitor-like YbhB/YbcL family protein